MKKSKTRCFFQVLILKLWANNSTNTNIYLLYLKPSTHTEKNWNDVPRWNDSICLTPFAFVNFPHFRRYWVIAFLSMWPVLFSHNRNVCPGDRPGIEFSGPHASKWRVLLLYDDVCSYSITSTIGSVKHYTRNTGRACLINIETNFYITLGRCRMSMWKN